ncbi:hypothetical protein QYM36_011619 [Artemia franciscana]|uniref:C2 domain-containing protein n=1 Tax=Artemia franciscana TaxID=6661 RepID=A0AA88HVM4_ARTSF|nr:hypothetical protein QYM36_011619 [Artemia franciscana]
MFVNRVNLFSVSRLIDLTSKPVYWRALKPPPKYKCGEVLISLCYHPANSLLTLTAIKARNLKAKDINGKSDPYVKVWLNFGDKRVEKRKTPVFPCTLDPVFNEIFTFHVPWEKIRDCSLDVRVMDFDNIGRNELIGRLSLSKIIQKISKSRVTDYPKGTKRRKALLNFIVGSCPKSKKVIKEIKQFSIDT